MQLNRAVGAAVQHKARSRVGRVGTCALVWLLVVSGVYLIAPAAVAGADTAPPTPDAGTATVSADPLPTVQINGIVWGQAVAKGKVYAGGQFSSARPAGSPAGSNETSRSNLLAYNLATGELDSSFNPAINGRVMAVAASPDGNRIYIAGAFTQVNGANRYRIAAFDTATGQLLANWAAGTNSTVIDIKATDTTVYVAGQFTNAGNAARTGFAAFSASNGALLPFNPVMSGGYLGRAIEISPDKSKVVVAGSFLTTNGSDNPGRGMAALDAVTGASLPWAINSVIRNAGNNSSIYSLASDGDSVYGSGYDFGGTKDQDDFEGSFRASWSDGTMQWMEDCHGDTYSVYPFQGVLYTAAHTHYCGNIGEFPQLNPWYLTHSLAFDKQPSNRTITPDIWGYRSFTGNPAGKLLHWFPIWGTGSVSGIDQAAWDVTASGDYLLYGGEFTSINGVKQQGLVRFAKSDKAPNTTGPTVQGGAWAMNAASFRTGQVRLSWQANYDADNAELTYQVFRRNVAEPLYTTKATSTYWNRSLMSFNDTTVTAGQTYDYRVRVTDPFGNTTQTDWKSVTVAAPGSGNAYNDKVLQDSPRYYWPLGEASGTVGFDWVSGNDLTLAGNTTRGVTGQVQGQPSSATTFGGSGAFGVSAVSENGPSQFSVEAWFKTTSTSGGKIVGFGNSATGQSSSYDRHIYLSGDGRITFGVYPGSVRDVSSTTGFNDGNWHQVVGVLSSAGQTLFVDGKKVGFRADATGAQNYAGYWRVGGDNVNGWPNAGAAFLSGTISDVAVYDSALSRDQVNSHWTASGRASQLPAEPADNYGKAVFGLDPALYWRLGEASGATAVDSGMNLSNGTYNGSINLGQAGALTGVSNSSIRFSSSKNAQGVWTNRQTVISNSQVTSPSTFAIEAWFKTTSSGGGKLIGFGNSNSNTANASSNYDRHVYMNPDGQLSFGVWNGNAQVLTAPGTYRDGNWHYVVAQQSAAGMQLFVDGVLVGSNAVSNAENYSGYWRLGGDTGWDGDPFWVGSMDDVAVYGAPLTAQQVSQHYTLGTEGLINQPPTAEFTSTANDLTVAFDASTSKDSEGPIADYSWDFGDGNSGSGVSPSHAYASAGTYHVTMTVRDGGNLTGSVTHDVTVQAPNQPPTPAFDITATPESLAVSVNADATVDDGSITDYAWNFGDGGTASGSTASHTYATAGTYDIVLTVTDDRGATGTLTRSVAVTAPKVAPVASFTTSTGTDGLTVAVNGTGSSDPDGTVMGYAWTFGDGQIATGATATNTYAAGGTYMITLTVTDNDGKTASTTKSVTVAVPPATTVAASDLFERAVTNGWGAADKGGTWTLLGGTAAFSVASGQGVVSLKPADTREARLSAVSSTDSTVELSFSSNTASIGGTTSVTAIGRQVGSSVYSARIRLEPTGTVRMYVLRDEVSLGTYVLPGAYTAGQVLRLKVQVAGTSPTTVQAKVWADGVPEPDAWQAKGTDSTAALQAAGFVGIRSAVSSASTVSTTLLRYDDLKVTTAP